MAYDKKRSHDFEGVRAICYYSVLPYLKNEDRVSMEEFWPLATDPKKEELDNESLLELIKNVKEAYSG